jgi:hypothetical protein
MSDTPESFGEEQSWIRAVRIPPYSQDWDRLINVYNIQELPALPADGDPGSEDTPLSVRVIREFFLDAANSFALEIWFDFAPDVPEAIDACFCPHGKAKTAIRIPKSLFFEKDEEYGVLGYLLENIADDGMFAIHVTEFKDKPKYSPFDNRGRIIQPPTPPESGDVLHPPEEDEIPGVTETVTIRVYRISLKGHTIPEDLVVQICPRFWHMPTGFQVG